MGFKPKNTTVMVSKITSGICVSVQTDYKGLINTQDGYRHVFAYQIEISNQSDLSVQLLRRQWHIIDSLSAPSYVNGDGVIGEKPVIAPGNRYQYESFCQLDSGMGAMKGNYTMRSLVDNECFEVDIPIFQLCAPFSRN